MSDTTLKALEAGTGGTDLGAISVMQGGVPVKVGKTHLVAADGSDAVGASVTAPPNGTGVLGWLRGIYDKLAAGIGRTWNLSSANDSVTVVQGGAWSAVVGDGGGSLTVDGTVNVGNFPATQPVSGTVAVNQGNAGAQAWPVSGPLTDAQLRASAVPVSGPLTDAQLRASAVPVSGPLTDTQLRASPVPANLAQVAGAAAGPANPLYTVEPPVTVASITGTAAAATTLTIAAPGAGLNIYVMGVEIMLVNTAARATAAATLITVTSTNLNGNPSWVYGSPVTAVGSSDRTVQLAMPAPIKSAAANTAVTLVGPATTGVQWHLKAYYYIAP